MGYEERSYWEGRYRSRGRSGEGLVHERAFLVERVIEWVEQLEAESILDVGVGTGELAAMILSRRPDLKYQAFDIAPTAVARARTRIPKAAVAVRDMVQGPSGLHDLSLCFNVHYHMATAERARRLIANVLDSTRKGAMFLTWNESILERGPLASHCHFHPFRVDPELGFRVQETVELPASPHKSLYILLRDET